MFPRVVRYVLVTAALAAVACRPPPVTNEDLARDPRQCPANEALQTDETFDARMLVNEPVGDATQVAQRYNCQLRVVVRDGRTVATGNPEPPDRGGGS